MANITQSRSDMIRILDDYIAIHSESENKEPGEGNKLYFARLNRMLLYYDMGMYRKALKDGIVLTATADECSVDACIALVVVLIALGSMSLAVDKLEAMLGDEDALVHGDIRQYLRAKRILDGIENGSISSGDVLKLDLDLLEQLQLCQTQAFSHVGIVKKGGCGEKTKDGGLIVPTDSHGSKSADRSRESELDRAILLVNSGRYKEAIKVLDECLALNDDAVLLATRGTAKAFAGDLEDSIQDFNKAIVMQPSIYDVYLRRSQALAALGKYALALEDLEKAKSLCHSNAGALSRIWCETAKVHEKMQCYGLLLSDVERALSLDERIQKDSKMVEMMGMGYIGTGDLDRGIECLLQANMNSPSNAKVLLNLGLCYKEKGMHEEAIDALTSNILISPCSMTSVKATAYRLLYQIYRSLGNPKKALEYIDLALDLQNGINQPEFLYMKGSCHHALGEFNTACSAYKSAVCINISDLAGAEYASAAFYQKEICLWTYDNRNQRMEDISLDLSFHPQFKELWCKKRPPSDTFAREYIKYMQNPICENIHSNDGWSNEETKRLLKISDTIGKLIQYQHDGFMPNSRQQRAAGLACIECAQFLMNIAKSDKPSDFLVSNKGSSSIGRGSEKMEFPVIHTSGTHPAGWRDAFDIIVKWRQLAEPSDPVVWVDLLSDQEFVSGFGSHTPMYTGETMCIRYYSNFSKATRLLHDLIVSQRSILYDSNDISIDTNTIESLDGLLKAKNAKDIWDVIGQDAWIAIPIQTTIMKRENNSLDTALRELEGSRLTVCCLKSRERDMNDRFSMQACQLGEDSQEKVALRYASTGYEFSIKTPVTPKRWRDYAYELDHIFQKLIKALCSDDSAEVLYTSLLLAFYWYNFMPLARGSAFCGYVMLLSARLAGGILGGQKIPDGVQVDWEAILEPSPERFADLMGSWISESDPAVRAPVHTVSIVPDIKSRLPTLESRIAALRYCDHG